MATPFFPLSAGVTWVYAVAGPVIHRIFKVCVEPQVDVVVEDLVTHDVRTERAWVLREDDAPKLTYAVEGDDGIRFLRESRVGPTRSAIVVQEDLRWAGAPSWSRPFLYYDEVSTMQYRRVGEEDVLVAAGRFRCVKILLDEGEAGAVWVARDVGIVREAYAVEGLAPTRYSVVELSSTPADARRVTRIAH